SRGRRLALLVGERVPEPIERALERDLDGMRLLAGDLCYLLRGQVGTEAKRDELAARLVELRDRGTEGQTANRIGGKSAGRRRVRRLVELVRRAPEREIGEAAAGDADQPADRRALRRVVAVPVAERTGKGLARDVLGVGPVADPVRDVGVDRADQ